LGTSLATLSLQFPTVEARLARASMSLSLQVSGCAQFRRRS
jgi:hypothetical protein